MLVCPGSSGHIPIGVRRTAGIRVRSPRFAGRTVHGIKPARRCVATAGRVENRRRSVRRFERQARPIVVKRHRRAFQWRAIVIKQIQRQLIDLHRHVSERERLCDNLLLLDFTLRLFTCVPGIVERLRSWLGGQIGNLERELARPRRNDMARKTAVQKIIPGSVDRISCDVHWRLRRTMSGSSRDVERITGHCVHGFGIRRRGGIAIGRQDRPRLAGQRNDRRDRGTKIARDGFACGISLRRIPCAGHRVDRAGPAHRAYFGRHFRQRQARLQLTVRQLAAAVLQCVMHAP